MQQNIFLKQPQLKSVFNLILTDYLCVCGCEIPTSYFDIAKGVIKMWSQGVIMWGSFLWANTHIYNLTNAQTHCQG